MNDNESLGEQNQGVQHEGENEEEEVEEDEIDLEKEKKRKEKAEELQLAVDNGNTNSLIRRVAFILNRYPETRNSDVVLQIQYWKEFENFTGNSVGTNKLFEYERLTSITRSRQKIQNEYKLYRADNPVRNWRSNNEEKEREKQIANKPSMPIVSVYADETGKNSKYTIIGSIWVLDDRRNGEITTELINWTKSNEDYEKFPKEFHFKEMDNRGSDLEYYKSFFDIFMDNSDMVSFKAIAVNREKLNRVGVSEILRSLYTQLVRTGVEHEKSTGRINPPKQISYTKDKEDGESTFELSQIQQEIMDTFKLHYDDDIKLSNFSSLPSNRIKMIQIADIFAASLNRIYNYQPSNTNRNAKDRLADYILGKINLNEIVYDANQFNEDLEVDFDTDMSTIFLFD